MHLRVPAVTMGGNLSVESCAGQGQMTKVMSWLGFLGKISSFAVVDY